MEEARARPSEQLSGALERHQSDVFYMNPPRLNKSGSLTEDFTYNKRYKEAEEMHRQELLLTERVPGKLDQVRIEI